MDTDNVFPSKNNDIENMTKEEILSAFRNGTITPSNDGKIWTDEDRRLLRSMYRQGICISDIAVLMGRKERSIFQQLEAMDEITTPKDARYSRPRHPVCKCKTCEIYICPLNPNTPSAVMETADMSAPHEVGCKAFSPSENADHDPD